MQHDQSTKLSQSLLDELKYALQMVSGYGSIEIYIQDSTITQITVRNIKKTKMNINGKSDKHTNGKATGFLK